MRVDCQWGFLAILKMALFGHSCHSRTIKSDINGGSAILAPKKPTENHKQTWIVAFVLKTPHISIVWLIVPVALLRQEKSVSGGVL